MAQQRRQGSELSVPDPVLKIGSELTEDAVGTELPDFDKGVATLLARGRKLRGESYLHWIRALPYAKQLTLPLGIKAHSLPVVYCQDFPNMST